MYTSWKSLMSWSVIFYCLDYSFADSKDDSFIHSELVKFYSNHELSDDGVKVNSEFFEQFRIRPLGDIRGPLPPYCHPRYLENLLVNRNSTAKDFALLADKYFKKCEKYWHGPQKKGKLAMLDYLFVEYDLKKNKSIEYTTIPMRDGSKINAYLAVQDKITKRPWIIAKCGVFCSAEDSTSVKNYLINLFDQSPFNVIFLSNRTGVDYIKENERLTLGGYLEVHDYYEVGRWLKEDSSYRETVDSLHVFGMSLAGSAAAYIDPLADAYGYDEDHRLFQSVLSVCPVLNLKPTIFDMYTNIYKRFLFSKLTWEELMEVKSALYEVDDLINRKHRPDYIEFPNLLGTIVSVYASIWGENLNTFRHIREIQSIGDLWELNQFVNLQKEIKTPFLVWASQDDSIVSNKINTASLARSWVYQNSPNLGVLNLKYGDHCGFATAYGFPVSSALMRSFVLNHSKSFLAQRSLNKKSYKFGSINFGLEKHLRQWWQAHPNMDYVSLHFETHSNLKMPWCFWIDIYDKNSVDCRRHTEVRVSLKVFSNFTDLEPHNRTEAEILSRRLNGLVRVTSSGRPLEGTSLKPDQIEWFDYSL